MIPARRKLLITIINAVYAYTFVVVNSKTSKFIIVNYKRFLSMPDDRVSNNWKPLTFTCSSTESMFSYNQFVYALRFYYNKMPNVFC